MKTVSLSIPEPLSLRPPFPVGALPALFKIRIALGVTFTAVAGQILFHGRWEPAQLPSALAVFLLAAGAGAINQFQDRHIDALMERTRHRPLPSGRVSPAVALLLGCLSALAGAALLFLQAPLPASALALFAFFWYIIVYAFLKRRSALAVIPGAWIGAVPPLIGWTAAGGSPLQPGILALALFLAVWQVPHFWLLALRHPADYRRAGLPHLSRYCTPGQSASLAALWILATVVAALFLPFGPGREPGPAAARLVLALAGLGLILLALRSALRPGESALQIRLFQALNTFALLSLVLLLATGST